MNCPKCNDEMEKVTHPPESRRARLGSRGSLDVDIVRTYRTLNRARTWLIVRNAAYNSYPLVSRVSASSPVEDPGPYTWTDRYHMMQDVRLWLRAPSRNFGWILIGDESRPQTAKVITSREHADPAMRPQLKINYRLPASR